MKKTANTIANKGYEDLRKWVSPTRDGEAVIVKAGMSQVEMTIWLCVMAVLALGMLAILAVAN